MGINFDNTRRMMLRINMNRYIVSAVLSALALVAGVVADRIPGNGISSDYQFPLHELGEIGKWTLVLLLGPVLVLEKVVEHAFEKAGTTLDIRLKETLEKSILPLIQQNLTTAATKIDTSFHRALTDTVGPTIRTTFTEGSHMIGTTLQSAVNDSLFPLMTKAFGDVNATMDRGLSQISSSALSGVGKTVESGLMRLSETVGQALLQLRIIQLQPDESPQKQDDNLAEEIPQQAASLAREGRIEEAVSTIQSASQRNPNALAQEQEVAVRILSTSESDWAEAAKMLESGASNKAEYFLRLSYKFWTINRLAKAIELAERGLALTGFDNADPEFVIARLKNSLAYFYAEDPRTVNRDAAYSYVRDARRAMPLNAEVLETEGCVQIAFGETKQEVIDGITKCSEAAKAKNDTSALVAWLARANTRRF